MRIQTNQCGLAGSLAVLTVEDNIKKKRKRKLKSKNKQRKRYFDMKKLLLITLLASFILLFNSRRVSSFESEDEERPDEAGDKTLQEWQLEPSSSSNFNEATKSSQKRHVTTFARSSLETGRKQLFGPQLRRRKSQLQVQEPPNELVFSNETGAVAQCGVALELARSIAKTEAVQQIQQSSQENSQQQFGRSQVRTSADIQVRWEREHGEEVEQIVYSNSALDEGNSQQGQHKRPLRFIRHSDGALVFEPFRAQDFRADLHSTTYRCIASSQSRAASLVSRDMRVRATLPVAPHYASQPQIQLEVLDELVVEGSSALLKCQVPTYAQEYLQVLDWIEYPGETLLSFQSTTQANADFLFHPTNQQQQQSHNVHRRQQQQQQLDLLNGNKTLARYFVSPKSGDLHIVNVDTSLSNRSYKCRCKNKLTGEVISSANKGKLIVSESHSPLTAPRIMTDSTQLSGTQAAYLEGELALLSCNVQAFSRYNKISWFRRLNELHSEPIESDLSKFGQVSSLLLIKRVNRNDSGVYLCSVKNSAGEERLELELQVRAPLKAKLFASSNVLELGKSLALECTVTGYPIHQVVFRHNQNVIKSISGTVGATMSQHHSAGSSPHPASSSSLRRLKQQHRPSQSQDGSYFVVDETTSMTSTKNEPLVDSSQTALTANQQLMDGSDIGEPFASGDANESQLPESDMEGATGSVSLDEAANEIKLSHVIVIVLEPQHAGAYQCFAYNQYESVQASAYIRVLDDPPKFKDTFKSEVFERRQDISLQCSARANPLPEITWSIDEQPIPENGRTRFGDFVTKDNLVISYVNISQTQVVDSGLYRCTADNGLAQVSHQAQISVQGELQVKPMGNVTVLASTTFRLRCPVAGFPVSEIQWQHLGRRLPTNHRQHVYENGTLEVEHMEKSQQDEGEYTCVARAPPLANNNGLLDTSASGSSQQQQQAQQTAFGSVFVSIKVRPTIEPFAISRSLREGQRASVMCTISSGDLPISISWFRNDQPLLELVSPDGAQAEQGLTLGPAQSFLAPQVATQNNLQMFSSLESKLGMNEQSSNNNNTNGNLLVGVRISRVSDYSSTLLFESLLAQHSANYTCLARNQAGQVSHTAPMVVQVVPKWSIEPADANVVRGSSASIDCMASGFPLPRIVWTKAASELVGPTSALPGSLSSSERSQAQPSGLFLTTKEGATSQGKEPARSHHLGSWRSIVSSPHLQVQENGSLNILDARDSDFGHYMCQASNGVGPGLSKVIKVTINVAAQFNSRHSIQYVVKGESAHLKCPAKGDWPLAVHWFKNKDRLEPINLRDSSTQSQSGFSTNTQLGQQSTLTSTSVASVLLVPNVAPGNFAFFHNSQAGTTNKQLKIGTFLDQLNALILSTSSANLVASSGLPVESNANLDSSVAGKQQTGSTLMQKYTLTTSEVVPSSQMVDFSKRTSTLSPFEHPHQLNPLQMAKVAPLLSSNFNSLNYQPQQPVVVQVNSMLSISQTERHDTSTFKCFAANFHGFDERTIQLIVQELPEKIEEFSSLEVNSRSITLGWLVPFDGNTPITNYHIQYKPMGSTLMQQQTTTTVAASSSIAGVQHQTNQPPMGPQMAQLASGQMSPEALNALGWFNYTLPGSVGSTSTNINSNIIMASSSSNHNGAEHDNNSSHNNNANNAFNQEQALFGEKLAGSKSTNAPVMPPGGPRTLVKITISSLRPVTLYWFRVAPENKLGLGAFSSVIESRTLEEAPGSAPSKLKAVAQSSSSILVSWLKLNEKEVFGSVQGYYVAYKALVEQSDTSAPSQNNSSQQQQFQPDLGLNKEQQQQQQQAGADLNSNSGMNIYKTIQHDDKLNKFDALLSGLKRSTKYLISVQAFNERGTGPSTEPVVVRTLEMDPPKQVKLYVKQASNCTIQLEWRPMSQAAMIQLQLLQNKPKLVGEQATGSKQAPAILPLAMPLQALSGSSSSGDQSSLDKAGAVSTVDVVDYYSLYQAELNDRPRWQEVRLPGHASSHTVENLRCGTRYQFYMMGVNKIGVGDQSDILDTKTVGGLPLAPDRQSTFDVVNTTCYVIRLDHWQNNGCPIQRFNVRYKPDLASVRDWTQLAHFNLIASDEEQLEAVNEQQQDLQVKNRPEESGKQSERNKRSLPDLREADKNNQLEDIYLFSVDDNPARADYEDSFLDYSLDGPNGNLADLADYPAESSLADFEAESSRSNLSQPTEQSSQLFNLLKDSMLPTFNSDDLMQSRLESLPGKLPTVAQEWQASNFVQNQPPETGKLANRGQPNDLQQQQQQVIKKQESVNLRTAHASRVSTNGPNQQVVVAQPANPANQDWRRVRLCGLVENIYYSIQITAVNSVGETEAELRILTSQEGLEYDQEIKRQVVGKLGADRMAQQPLSSIGDRFNLFGALHQWPSVLLPMTLTFTLVTILIIITLLLKRNSSSPGSTSTTTTMSSSSDSHCQNYLDHHHHHHHSMGGKHGDGFRPSTMGGAESGITELGNNIDGYTLAGNSNGPIEGFSPANNGTNLSIYQQRGSNQSVLEEPAYGLVSRVMNPGASASSCNGETNRSSSSPATTTAATTSMNSGSTGNSGGSNPAHAINHGIYLRSEALAAAAAAAQVNQENNPARARNVYLCSTAGKDEQALNGNSKSDQLFYGMAASIPAAIYGGAQQTVQVRHFQQPEDQVNQQMFQQSGGTTNDLYAGISSAITPQHEHNNQEMADNSANTGGQKIDNCFMNIVEEVARANDNLQQQQRTSQLIKAAALSAQQQQDLHQQLDQTNAGAVHQCNQLDCFNSQHFHLGEQVNQVNTNYAAPGEDVCKHNQNQDQSANQNGINNRLMFDPVYATIRRTFPQAFRYLTLQQHHLHHQNQGQQQQQQQQSQHLSGFQQASISPINSSSNNNRHQTIAYDHRLSNTNDNHGNHQNLIDNFANKRQQSFDSQTVHNMSLFNSNNLAALNLLTPTSNVSTPFSTTAIVQQPTNGANNNQQQ